MISDELVGLGIRKGSEKLDGNVKQKDQIHETVDQKHSVNAISSNECCFIGGDDGGEGQ